MYTHTHVACIHKCMHTKNKTFLKEHVYDYEFILSTKGMQRVRKQTWAPGSLDGNPDDASSSSGDSPWAPKEEEETTA